MKHLFTLSERLKGRWRGSVTSAISATSASAIFCKLVGMVKLFMPFMKATRRQSDTTFFAESAESAESAKPIFANRGVKDVRVSLDQYPTNIQRISNLYITPNRYFTRFAAVFALVFVLGVGDVWGADPDHTASHTYTFTTSGCSGWTGSSCGSYCGGYGKSSGTPTITNKNISDFQAVDFDLHENVSLTIKVKGGNNGGTQTCTVTLIDKDGNKVSTYSDQKAEAYNGN